jgi:hypothetical protein
VEYKKIKNLKKTVETILRDCPNARNSDITLTLYVWHKLYPESIQSMDRGVSAVGFRLESQYVFIEDLYWLPREDNIKRLRAKLQEEARDRIRSGRTRGDEECFFPTDPKVAKHRGILEDEWRVAVGYPTKETAGTDKPSWSPLSEMVSSGEKEQGSLIN